MKKAVIAIGSNSTRLIVGECTDGVIRDRYVGRAETRLFMGLGEGNALSSEAMLYTVDSLAALKEEAQQRGAADVDLLATSATRDASNADVFEKLICARTGLKLRVISGEEEARYAFGGAAGNSDCIVMDIGGGSTELSRGKNGTVCYARSNQVGASRLLKMQDITCGEDAARVTETAKAILLPAVTELKAYGRPERLIGIGGSCTTAVAIMQGAYLGSDNTDYHELKRDEVERQLTMLAGMTPEERKQVKGLPETRVKHMPHGLCILLAAMELLEEERIYVTGRTILDGYLLFGE